MADAARLKLIANSPAASQSEREGALEQLRRMAQGGASGLQCVEARSALTEIGDLTGRPKDLQSELLAGVGAASLGEVEYADVHRFCSDRQWNADARKLYDAWASQNPHALQTVLAAYLAAHHESRMTAKHLLQGLGKRWPSDWISRDTLHDFVRREPECEDARLVIQEYLDKGTLERMGERPPRTCQCWKLSDAIHEAKRQNNPQLLFDEIQCATTGKTSDAQQLR